MKKFLSLVLALVMTMSLVTISAGAEDFTDADEMNYVEAVEVMSAVDVIDGYADGSFNPQNGLTRGAAAKIICNMILGPTTASALNADTAPYSDVSVDHTFAGYIAYCQKEGIISGYADGTFRPSAPLTGYAFMKMLLGALGYDAEVEQYVGANWSINVAKRALNLGLDDGLVSEFNGSKALTREEAALYAFNTLKATMVTYPNSSTVVVGDITVKTNAVATEVEQDADEDTIKGNKKTEFAEKYFPKLTLTDTEHDDFMRPAHEWKYKKASIGTYVDAADVVYTTSVKAKEIRADLTANYDAEDITVYVDGVEDEDFSEDFEINKNCSEKTGANGVLTEVYVIEGDDEDTIRIVQVNTYVAVVAGDYDDEDEEVEVDIKSATELNPDTTLKLDDFAMIEDLKEDDVVLLTITGIDEDEDVIKSIEVAETFTEAVTNYESNYNEETNFEPKDTVTAGDKYSYDKNFATSIEGFDGSYAIKDEYDFYLDNYGYVIYVEGVAAEKNYVYVDGFEASGLSAKATLKGYAYFVDGTTEVISIKTIGEYENIRGEEAMIAALAGIMGEDTCGLFSYTVKNDKYTLEPVETFETSMAPAWDLNGEEDDDNDASDAIDEDGKLILADALDFAGLRGSKNTVFIVIDADDEVEVYTGIKNVPVITIADAEDSDDHAYIAFTDDDSTLYAEYVFIDLGDTGSTSGRAKGGDVMFLYENSYSKKGEDSDENVYHTYKVLKDGEKTTVKFDETATDLDAGLYIGVKYDDNGYACDWTKIEAPEYAPYNDPEDYSGDTYVNGIIEKKGDVLTVWEGDNASTGYYMADDCDVTFIVDEDTKNVSWKKIDGVDYTVDAIWGVMNSDAEYTELFIALTEVE